MDASTNSLVISVIILLILVLSDPFITSVGGAFRRSEERRSEEFDSEPAAETVSVALRSDKREAA